MAVVQRMTAEEFLALDTPPDARRHDLIDGEVVVNSPRLLHQRVFTSILLELELWTRSEHGKGLATPFIDILLDEDNVFAPDILWYSDAAWAAGHPDPPYRLPDLAVEVRSPSTWRYDIGTKKSAYERHGLAELWLVDTAASEVLVFRRSKSDARGFDVALELTRTHPLCSPLLPDLEIDLGRLFGV